MLLLVSEIMVVPRTQTEITPDGSTDQPGTFARVDSRTRPAVVTTSNTNPISLSSTLVLLVIVAKMAITFC